MLNGDKGSGVSPLAPPTSMNKARDAGWNSNNSLVLIALPPTVKDLPCALRDTVLS
jgi:hypothetical protein